MAAALLLAGLAVPAAPQAQAQAGTGGRVAGYGIYVRNGEIDRFAGPQGAIELERMRRTGANTLLLDALWTVPGSKAERIDPPRDLAAQDAALAQVASKARHAGLNVMLAVKTYCPGCKYAWRGSLEPDDPTAFLVGSRDPNDPAHGAEGTYLYMSNHYAELATRIGAQAYFFASEMASLQGATPEWQIIALESRQRFNGRTPSGPRLIGYQANWDSMGNIGFWDEVDIAGLSAYVPLSAALQPNLADILQAWRNSTAGGSWDGKDWFSEIKAFHESTKSAAFPNGKPVLFGEVGYQSARQAGHRPWGATKTDGYDPQLQADLYQGVLTMFGDQPWWLGALWWEWVSLADEGDLGYSPRAKLAEQLLTKWYAGERPPTRETSLVGVTRPSSKTAPRPANADDDDESPSGTVSRPVTLAPRLTAPPIRTGTPSSAPSTAAPPTLAAPLPSAVPTPVESTPEAAPAPQLPDALAAVRAGTVEDALRRAAFRDEMRRAATGAIVLLVVALLCHSALAGPRVARLVRRGRPVPVLAGAAPPGPAPAGRAAGRAAGRPPTSRRRP